MAATLHAMIMAGGYRPGMLATMLATGGVADGVGVMEPVVAVTPLQFAAPRPSRTAACFSRIFLWEESEEGNSPLPSKPVVDGYDKLSYLHHGGLYEQRVLAVGRRAIEGHRNLLQAVALSDPARANEVSQWPPAPHPIANWGTGLPERRQMPAKAIIDDDLEAPTAGPFATASEATVAPGRLSRNHHAATPGFFIGSDGTEWPVPPAECARSALGHLPALTALGAVEAEIEVDVETIDYFSSPAAPTPAHIQSGSWSSSTLSSTLPTTPRNEGDGVIFNWRPPTGLGVIGEGRPLSGVWEGCPPKSTLFSPGVSKQAAVAGWSNSDGKNETSSRFRLCFFDRRRHPIP